MSNQFSAKYRAYGPMLRDLGLTILEVRQSKHLRVRVEYAGHQWWATLPGTPSDHRTLMNTKADLLREMRKLGHKPEGVK